MADTETETGTRMPGQLHLSRDREEIDRLVKADEELVEEVRSALDRDQSLHWSLASLGRRAALTAGAVGAVVVGRRTRNGH